MSSTINALSSAAYAAHNKINVAVYIDCLLWILTVEYTFNLLIFYVLFLLDIGYF